MRGNSKNEEENQLLIDPSSNSTVQAYSTEEQQSESFVEKMAPPDRKSIVYWQFFFLGLASLLPWNFFITADSYWSGKFHPVGNGTESNGTDLNGTFHASENTTAPPEEPIDNTLHKMYRSFFSIFSMFPQILFTFYSSVKQKGVNERLRVYGGLTVMTLIFVITSCFVKIDTDPFQKAFFGITMISIFIVNSSSAFVQASVFGQAAKFPERYNQGVMAGQGMGGLFSAIAFLVAISLTEDPTNYALIFFVVAVVFLVLSIICYNFMEHNPYYLHYKSHTITDSEEQTKDENGEEILLENGKNKEETTEATFGAVFGKIYPHFFCCFFTFFVTLANFPSLTASVKSTNSDPDSMWASVYFIPVSCFFLFNFSDFIGRSLPSLVSIPRKSNVFGLFLLAISRTVFFFVFTYCNAQPRAHDTRVLFNNDIYFIVFMFLFGLTNGYVSTLAMKYSPQFVKTSAQRQLAGKIMAFSITCGLASGAAFSFIVVSWL